MATSSTAAARRFLDSLRALDDSSREGLAQLHRVLDLAEAHADLEEMSLNELIERYNTQRATISAMIDENRELTEKARRLDAIRAALDA